MPIYHITSRVAWESALAAGEYSAESLATEGFQHFSLEHQWRLTQQRYYQGQAGLVRLRVDAALAALRMENGFPHLYGPLAIGAVSEVKPLATARDLRVSLFPALHPSAAEVAATGADLVVLPEMAFDPWFPCTKLPYRDAAPASVGENLARQAGVAVCAGVLENQRNVTYVWDATGAVVHRYEKLHLPSEPGFWESDHYGIGDQGPTVCDSLGFPFGVQTCSDINRPFGADFLRAQGAGCILAPRATEQGSYENWKLVYRAVARMNSCYVLSVNRPHEEGGVPLGGPSLAVGPDGSVLAEGDTLDVSLSVETIVAARAGYPGYLEIPLEVYAKSWQALARLARASTA